MVWNPIIYRMQCETIHVMTTATNWSEFNAFPKDERLKTIKQLLQNGASIRQMEKLTGIGRGTIQNL